MSGLVSGAHRKVVLESSPQPKKESDMNKIQKLTTVALAGSLSLGLAATAASAASASTGPKASSINLNATCSKGSLGNLQVQREDTGQLSIDVGVDMTRHTAGVPWTFRVTDNGSTVTKGTTRTIGDGSFSVSKLMWPKGGANHFVFTAKNVRTGETCKLIGTV
jgi:hypothetical protein